MPRTSYGATAPGGVDASGFAAIEEGISRPYNRHDVEPKNA
jgi:hypothetical protein